MEKYNEGNNEAHCWGARSVRLLKSATEWTKCVFGASLRPWKPKTCSLRSEDRLHPCALSCECSAPTLRQRKQKHESLQFRASTRTHAACVEFESLSPLTMTLKVAIV